MLAITSFTSGLHFLQNHKISMFLMVWKDVESRPQHPKVEWNHFKHLEHSTPLLTGLEHFPHPFLTFAGDELLDS